MTFNDELLAIHPALVRWANYLTRDADKARDLVQSTLLRAIEKRHQYQPGTNLKGWCFMIMRNQHVSNHRRAGRFVQDPDDHLMLSMRINPQQEDHVQLKDVWKLFQGLPEAQQRALYLIGVEGETYGDTADILEIPEGSVKSQVSRARSKLKEQIA